VWRICHGEHLAAIFYDCARDALTGDLHEQKNSKPKPTQMRVFAGMKHRKNTHILYLIQTARYL
jgi:hypothetical protein